MSYDTLLNLGSGVPRTIALSPVASCFAVALGNGLPRREREAPVTVVWPESLASEESGSTQSAPASLSTRSCVTLPRLEQGTGATRRTYTGANDSFAPGPGTPADVAGVVVFLVSDAAAYMTGQANNITGGL